MSRKFRQGSIDGVIIESLDIRKDKRGWLTEIFRSDTDMLPAMCYLSLTNYNELRGPHEHKIQTDVFSFIRGNFFVILWDNREESPTYNVKMKFFGGSICPIKVTIPPGVVHCYRCVSDDEDGLVINCPDQLYAGYGKKLEVDEIRYEQDLNNIFVVDEGNTKIK